MRTDAEQPAVVPGRVLRSRLNPTVARLLRARSKASETTATKKLALLRRLEKQKVFRDLPETRVEQSFNEQLFAKVFDYRTLLSHEGVGFHLLPKNATGPRRFDDFSLGFFGTDEERVIATAEFKSPGTNLDAPQTGGNYGGQTPVQQAFAAVQSLTTCKWVIVSNFRELRLYDRGDQTKPFATTDLHDIRNGDDLALLCSHFDRTALLGDDDPSGGNARMTQALREDFPGRPIAPEKGYYRTVLRFSPKGPEQVLPLSRIEQRLRDAIENAKERDWYFAKDAYEKAVIKINMSDGWVWTEGRKDNRRVVRFAISRFGEIIGSMRILRSGDITLYELKNLTLMSLRLCRTIFGTVPLARTSVISADQVRSGHVGMELLDVAGVWLQEPDPKFPQGLLRGTTVHDEVVAGDFGGDVPLGIIDGCAMCISDLAIQFRDEAGGVVVSSESLAADLLSSI